MSDVAIKIENLSKQYRLGIVGTQTLRGDLQRFWWNLRGKGDPTLKIGQENTLSNAGGEYVWALKDINIEIKKGEILGIIGKNGAGKSTLLKILSRVTGPTTGSVKVNGRLASLLEVGTGFHPELTGRENIYLNGAILGMTKTEIKKQFDEIIDFAGIAKYIDTPVKRYSSGMYVRLGFAVAAHLNSEILVVDEVLAVGDAEFQKKAIGKMQDISAGQGKTVLFVSHNMASVEKLCNRSVLLKNGKIDEIGEVSDIVNKYMSDNFSDENLKYFANIKKDIYIQEVEILGNKNNIIDFDEDIRVHLRIIDVLLNHSFRVGLAVKNNKNNKVFTTVSPKVYSNAKKYEINLKIPQRTLLSGEYSIDVSIFIPGGINYDHVFNICNFNVNDTKSDLAFFAGQNIGDVNIICTWD